MSIKVKVLLPSTLFEPTKYELLEPLQVKDITVPKGFITDGASVPRMFWSLFPPTGRYLIAAVVHDYILETSDKPFKERWKYANRVFKEVLKMYNIPKWAVFVLHTSVVLYSKLWLIGVKISWLR